VKFTKRRALTYREKDKRVDKLLDLNEDLLDTMRSLISWLLRYTDKYKIPLPNEESLLYQLDRVTQILEQMSQPTNLEQPSGTTRDGTEP
jgi:hypothetical protein